MYKKNKPRKNRKLFKKQCISICMVDFKELINKKIKVKDNYQELECYSDDWYVEEFVDKDLVILDILVSVYDKVYYVIAFSDKPEVAEGLFPDCFFEELN